MLWGTGLSLSLFSAHLSPWPLVASPFGTLRRPSRSALLSSVLLVYCSNATAPSSPPTSNKDRNRRVSAMQCSAMPSQNSHLRSLRRLPKHEDKQQRNTPTVHADWRKLRDVKVLQEHAMIRVADLVPFHWLLGAFQLGPHLRSNRRLNATSLHDVELH